MRHLLSIKIKRLVKQWALHALLIPSSLANTGVPTSESVDKEPSAGYLPVDFLICTVRCRACRAIYKGRKRWRLKGQPNLDPIGGQHWWLGPVFPGSGSL